MPAPSSPALHAEPNVTPMVDVMLVLLIIFMVVTPTLMLGFVAEPPEGVHLTDHSEESGDRVLGIDSQGQYFLNKTPVDAEALPELLRQQIARRPDNRMLYILAHRSLEYRHVRDALDVSAANGIVVAGLITEQAHSEAIVPRP
jgi:biopolymer transport protein ExbD